MFHFKCWPLVVLVLPPCGVMMNYGGEMRRSEAREKLKFTMPELQQAAGAGVKIVVA